MEYRNDTGYGEDSDTSDNSDVVPSKPMSDHVDLESQIPYRQLRSTGSTTASVRVELFDNDAAGVPITSPTRECPTQARSFINPDNIYYPFKDNVDYAMARWLLESECTQGDVDRFFSDPRLSKFHSHLSFKSGIEWKQMMMDVPHGVIDSNWTQHLIRLPSHEPGADIVNHTVYSRDVTAVLKFLMGHSAFKDDMVYAPERHWHPDRESDQIFTEMHTGHWWWETQQKLPRGATVIPVLLATDKTQMSQHHGDVNCWPVYLTIGNIASATRRKQSATAIVLLGFIPVVKGEGNIGNMEMYHYVLGMMLKRKYYTSTDKFWRLQTT